jgi:hypothetical protein
MTRFSYTAVLMLAMAGVMAPPSRADEPAVVNAGQVAGLFMQSCLQFAGDRDGLRAWVKTTKLKELPPTGQDYFLHGLAGVVFDASTKEGKFVLVSEDGGSCSVLAEIASGPAVLTDLEKDMTDAQIAFKITSDRDDAEEKALRHREYTASKGDHGWLLLVSTVKGDTGGEVMLTANRY